MKKILYLAIPLVMVLFSWCLHLFVNKYFYEPLNNRVEIIENSFKKLQAEKVQAASTEVELKEKIATLKYDLTKEVDEAKEKSDNIVNWGIPITIATILGLFFSIYKFVFEEAVKEAKIKVAEEFRSEEVFKTEKKILIYNPDGADVNFLKRNLSEMGFVSVVNCNSNDFEQALTTPRDAIFLNNRNEKGEHLLNEDGILEVDKKILDKCPKAICVYFGKPITYRLDDTRWSAVNFKTQIYGNLINALKYQMTL